MSLPNIRKHLLTRFTALYVLTLALLIIIFSAFREPAPKIIYTPLKESTKTNDKTILLKKRIADLQDSMSTMDKQVEMLKANINTSSYNATDKQVRRLQDELTEKSSRIIALEKQINKPVPKQEVKRTVADAPLVKDLQKRNTNLSTGFNDMLTRVGLLTKSNTALQRENARLTTELNARRKSDGK